MPESWSKGSRPSHSARSGEALAGVALLLCACTEPMFREEELLLDGGTSGEDAGRPGRPADGVDPPDVDAEVILPTPFPAILPEWATNLRGRYALRVRYYGRQQGAERSSEIVALAEIGIERHEVQLKTILCDFTSELRDASSEGPSQRMSLVHPEYDPQRVYTLRFENDSRAWQTSTDGTNVGYLDVVHGCSPGALIDRRAPRQWLGEPKCKCPDDLKAVPSSLDDCRLTDPDIDKSPGVALQLAGPINGIDHVVRHEASEFVIGTVDPMGKRHTAKFKPVEEMSALQCSGRPCEKPPPTSYCYVGFNPAVFERIPDGVDGPEAFDCADIRSEIADRKLLVEDQPPAFPAGC